MLWDLLHFVVFFLFQNALYMVGGAVGFYSGDIRRLADDLQTLKPTMMPAVPRLLNRLYDKAQSEISSSKLKKLIFNMALSAKESEVKRWVYTSYFNDCFTILFYRVCKLFLIVNKDFLRKCAPDIYVEYSSIWITKIFSQKPLITLSK